LRDNGIQTIVWLSPILPFINDTEENLNGLLDYCIEAKVYGIICFEMGLTLREGDREYFYKNLDKHFPGLKEQYQTQYGYNYILKSDNNKKLMEIFHKTCDAHHIVYGVDKLFNYMQIFEEKNKITQSELF
jgi:DNA repair photolyase